MKKKNNNLQPSFFVLLLMGAMGVMGGAIIAPALPSLLEPFGIGEDRVGLVLSVYTLAAAITLPFIGLFIDIWGRRRMGILCLIIDGIFGLLCTLAPSFSLLLVFRFVQGMGIAGLIPVAMTIISDCHQGQERLRRIGYLSGSISASAVILPLLGGLLAVRAWQFPFLVYSLSLLLALFFYFFVEESSSEREIEGLSLNMIRVYLTSLGQAIKLSTIREVFLHSLTLFFLLYTVVTFIPVYLVQVHGLTTLIAGLALSIQGLLAALVATRARSINALLGWRNTARIGLLLLGLGLFLIPRWSTGQGIVLSLIIFGLGMGFTQPAIYNRATVVAPVELTGSVISLFNTMKYIGMSLAPPLLGVVYLSFGYSGLFYTSAAVAVFRVSINGFFYGED